MSKVLSRDALEFRTLLLQTRHGFDHFFWSQPAQAVAWFSEDETPPPEKQPMRFSPAA